MFIQRESGYINYKILTGKALLHRRQEKFAQSENWASSEEKSSASTLKKNQNCFNLRRLAIMIRTNES